MRKTAKFVALMVAALILNGAFHLIAQTQVKKGTTTKKQEETYTRPQPTRPIKPEIPGANRYQENKVFLEYADSLYTLPVGISQPDLQIVKGSVKFRHGGMFMYCDSAYYYPESNSMDAFGHVRMEQGDTLFVYADKLYYRGNQQMASLGNGPTNPKVRLINRNTTLTTDSLDYDLQAERGWFDQGGTLDDKVNTLTSRHGEYSLRTKDAKFSGFAFGDVILVNNKDGYRMVSDNLDYNTDTHIASISTRTIIEGANDTIITTRGWYDTNTDNAELLSRSTIIHRDSVGNVTTLEGDSILYDKLTRISRAYMFRDPFKNPQPMVLTDTANKMILKGGYGEYNDSSKYAFSTFYPLLIEYSRPDTLFLRADTIRTFIEQRMIYPELTEEQVQHRWEKWQTDSLEFVTVMEDSLVADSLKPKITLTQLRKQIIEDRDSSELVAKDYHVAQAYHRARFFKQDIQGVADSIAYVEFDSILYMYRKPAVWSGERQIFGNRINVHLNDSTADWAYLPDKGFASEHIEDEFYNQLSGKTMKAFFEGEDLTRLEVEGNVMTIVLPVENDSTYNKLVNAESSFLTVDMHDQKMDKIKMWPEVSGTVIPLFMIKQNQLYLPGFQQLEAIRPKRAWYNNKWNWEDDLGELPEELELYFEQD